jgi:hypothetical protein
MRILYLFLLFKYMFRDFYLLFLLVFQISPLNGISKKSEYFLSKNFHERVFLCAYIHLSNLNDDVDNLGIQNYI